MVVAWGLPQVAGYIGHAGYPWSGGAHHAGLADMRPTFGVQAILADLRMPLAAGVFDGDLLG
jgi:hypothetical protein